MFESETFEQCNKRLRSKNQANYRKRQKTRYGTDINSTNNQNSVGMKRHELGRMDKLCIHCGAKFWMNEKDTRHIHLFLCAVLVVKSDYPLCLGHLHI